jgi:hypothetical protein
MKDLLKENNRQKHQFKSYYCARCRQVKPCQLLTGWSSEWKSYCCSCYYEGERDRGVEYSSLEKVLESKREEKQNKIRQLQLLKSYLGCKWCKSLAVDAYSLYEKNKLVCQPCLMRKEGGSSSPISFLGQGKWYKKRWGVDINWWLESYGNLPVNAECAREWAKDKNHLNNCQCLEQEAKENYLLVNDSLERYQTQLKKCQCETSPKVRVDSDDFAWCEKCKVSISVASKKRVIKNRNDPRFWGLDVKEKVLCGNCLKKLVEEMPKRKKYLFWEYRNRRYWEK